MQNYNQTESVNYPSYLNISDQSSFENAVSFSSSEMNTTDDSLALIDSASYQSDSNSAFFNGPASVDYNTTQTNFLFNDKYPSNGNLVHPQFADEISQTSTCSSQLDDTSRQQSIAKMNSVQKQQQQQQANQLKSVPEESVNQLPVTYQSPNKAAIFTSPSGTSKAKKNESIAKLYEMSNEPERKPFLEKLFEFNEKNNKKMLVCPSIAKNLIDLFKVYNLVKEKGGFVEVCKNQSWKEIALTCGFPITSTTAYSLRKQYIKHLLDYECKFDLNGANPDSLKDQTDAIKNSKRTKSKPSQNSSPTANLQQQQQQQQQQQPQSDIQMNYLSPPPSKQQQQPNTFLPQFQSQQPVYKHSSPNQLPNSNQIVKPQPMYGQVIYNNYEPSHQPQLKNEQMMNYDQSPQSQFMNQLTNDQLANYDLHVYPALTNQRIMNQYYNQYESDGQLNYQSNQVPIQKTTTTTNQQYYSDSNQYNANQYTNFNDQMQYLNYNYQQQSDNVYTDSSRMPVTTNRTMSTTNEQQQYSSSKPPYQFTSNYDYAPVPVQQQQTQQMNRTATSQNQAQTNYNYNQYQATRVQQPQFMLENGSSDAKQQYNQIENWQINNSSKGWNHPNSYYSPQQLNQTQQQFSIESPVPILKVQHQHQPPLAIQQQLPNNYYPNNLVPKYQPNQLNYPMQSYQHVNQFNSALLDQQQMQLQQQLLLQQQMQPQPQVQFQHHCETTIKTNTPCYVKFPPDCIESIKPKSPITKRKLTSKDLSSCDYKKWIMSLKSGLLGESTQALNGFSIVSSEDSTCNQIKLNKNPGLLPYLMHYFKFFLSELFPDIFSLTDSVNSNGNKQSSLDCNGSIDQQEQQVIEPNLNKNNSPLEHQPMLGELADKMVDRELKYDSTNDHSFISTSLHPNKRTKVEQEQSSLTDFKPKTPKKINYFDVYENEAKEIDVDTLSTISNYKEDNNKKCICISTLIRNLSLVSSNEQVLTNDKDLLSIIGKILLYGHEHNEKKVKRNLSLEQIDPNSEAIQQQEKKSNEEGNRESWWIEALNIIQENAFVTLTQMSACLNLKDYDENLILPILIGLLHWSLCPSSQAEDNFKYTSIKSCSPKRLALECLAKLSIFEDNVDLILATQPLNEDCASYSTLTKLLSPPVDQIIREFALVLLHNFIISDQGVATAIGKNTNIINELVNFLVQYEDFQNKPDNQYHQDFTLDMAKRAAISLKSLAQIKETHSLFSKQEHKLSALSFSNVLDSTLSKLINEILFELSFSQTEQPSLTEQSDQLVLR